MKSSTTKSSKPTKTSAEKTTEGVCYLVGAGPGDPGLLTLRGRECLERADVVIYDYLSNAEFLNFAPPKAEKIYAGKTAGRHALTQEQTNELIVKHTREGKRVVRLKGGDPFLFGRGGEEAGELSAEGLRFEIVPGVTSAIGGLAYAGIPVTHRASNAVLTIFTGHEEPGKKASGLDYKSIALAPGTKVMLMGVERLAAITGELAAAGMSATTPVALVRWATTGRHQTLVGTLGTIAALAEEKQFKAPAVAVFGDVVNLRDTLSWFERRPLFGRRIAVTRSRQQSGGLLASLRELGADAYEIPTIRIEPPADKTPFIEAMLDVRAYDWLVFTSPNGVEAFFNAFFASHTDARELGGARIAVIGNGTAKKVREYRYDVDLIPEEFVAESLLKAFKELNVENLRMLLPRAAGAREILAVELENLGAIVDDVPVYQTVPETEDVSGGIRRFREEGADMITFTSASTAAHFMALGLSLPAGMKTASIGPVTTQEMVSLGLIPDVEASQHDIPGLVHAISSFYEGEK
ncbi:MAG: uroporphyrinogen-III C-methyltransferase [Verrucomicrobia bacterium]|nr:MAG: uroporphyrinogen-III C-methyltransferase [Verrucomicrobiota bacterium]